MIIQMSHVSPDFIPVFGDCLRMLRYVSSDLVDFSTLEPIAP
jgi:hypothetical protein